MITGVFINGRALNADKFTVEGDTVTIAGNALSNGDTVSVSMRCESRDWIILDQPGNGTPEPEESLEAFAARVDAMLGSAEES